MRKLIVAVFLFAFASGAAFAHSCPMKMERIDEALESGDHAELAGHDLDWVHALRARGDELHRAGRHDDAVETLEQAIEMLGIES